MSDSLAELGALDGLPTVVDFQARRLDPAQLDAFIARRGVTVEYRAGVLCPCRSADTNHARIDCTACGGVGWIYPVALRRPAFVLMTSRNHQRHPSPAGDQVSGQASCTFQTGIVPGQGDQVWPSQERHVVQQVIPHAMLPVPQKVAAALMADSDFPPPTVQPVGDRLLYPDILEIVHASWYDAASRKLIEVEEGLDFNAVSRETYTEVVWKPNRAPTKGAQVSFRYLASAVYMLEAGEPRYRQEGPNQLPYFAQAWRLDKVSERDLR